jgi:hypothetical protein
MAVFPTLSSGVITKTPATLGSGFATRVMRFCDDTEQRFVTRYPFSIFVLQFTNINGYDLSQLVAFFRTVKGQYDSSWTLTINGTTCPTMNLDSDDLLVVENVSECFTLSVKCRNVFDAIPSGGGTGQGTS